MRIAIIYDKFREDTLGEHYKRALIRAGHIVEHFWLRDAHHIEPIYNAYLRIDDGDYKYDIPHKRLRPSFFYASDVHLKKPFLAIKKIVGFYNHVFCAQYIGYIKLKSIYGDRISWLPHACDSEFQKDLGCQRKLDIAFVGNDGGIPRKFLLQEIRERFPNSYIGNASYMDIAKIYSSAKIGFNYSIGNDINMRIFEVMGCGAMLLTNYIDNNGFGELFVDKKDVVTYKSPKDLFETLNYYLHEDLERHSISESGHMLVVSNHTYDKRALVILRTITRYTEKGV